MIILILIFAVACTDIALIFAIHRYDKAYKNLYNNFIKVMEAVNIQAVSEKEFEFCLKEFNNNITKYYRTVLRIGNILETQRTINGADSKQKERTDP